MFEQEDDEAERRRGRGAAHLSRPWSRQPRGKHPPPPPVKDSAPLLSCSFTGLSTHPKQFYSQTPHAANPSQPQATNTPGSRHLTRPSVSLSHQTGSRGDRHGETGWKKKKKKKNPSAVPVTAITFQMDISASAPHPPLSPHCFFFFLLTHLSIHAFISVPGLHDRAIS